MNSFPLSLYISILCSVNRFRGASCRLRFSIFHQRLKQLYPVFLPFRFQFPSSSFISSSSPVPSSNSNDTTTTITTAVGSSGTIPTAATSQRSDTPKQNLRGLNNPKCGNFGRSRQVVFIADLMNLVAESAMVGLSVGEKHFIRGGIAQDLRADGRKQLTYRPISVETGVIPQASGSARVRMGTTDVIASVKAELGKPDLLQPDKGRVIINVDCSPTAAPIFEGRGGEELSTELLVALQRCLLGSKSGTGAGIDRSSLMVVGGKLCWDLYIDGLVVSSDGNLLDALGAAIKESFSPDFTDVSVVFGKAALTNTGIPKVHVATAASADEQPEVDISDEEFLQFDTSGIPVIVTLTKVGKHYIVDATSEEESQMSSAVSVSVNRNGLICGLTKRGAAGLDPSVILDMISVAKHVSEQLMNKLDSEISAAEADEAES